MCSPGPATAVNRRLRLGSFVWPLLLACVGCSAEDVVVARESPAALPCTSASDCALPDEYCAKPFCGSPQGQCLLRPVACGNQFQLVCGCDSVIYWNDCLRQRDGIAASTPGQCASPVSLCDDTDAGGCVLADATCGRLLPPGRGPCPPAELGVCWVLPDVCPEDDAAPPRWSSCLATQPEPCVDLCTALRSQQPYKRALGPECH